MKKTSPLTAVLILFIICLPIFYTWFIYAELPSTIPLHFNIDGEPDRFGDKNKIWFSTLLLTAVSIGTYLLLVNLPKIDPKKTAGQSIGLYHRIAMALVIFLCATNIIIIYATKQGSVNIGNLIFPLLGLLYTVLGNYMHSIKPNYFVGFRTPWALENEENWRKTHRLVGKIWVPGGLLVTVLCLLAPVKAGIILFFSVTVIMVLIPFVFSYRLYQKTKQAS